MSIRTWLGMALLGVCAVMPWESNANQDSVYVLHGLQQQGALTGRGSEFLMGHRNGATEGYGIYDAVYSYPGPWDGQWAPKVVTHVGGYDLSIDRRDTNSFTDFTFYLSVIIQNGESFDGTNQLSINMADNSVYDYIPSNEHWTIAYAITTNYYTGGAAIKDTKNMRDLCPLPNTLYNWNNGVGINIPFSDADVNGEVIFGSGVLHREHNKLVSSSTGPGSNSFEGADILNYGTNRTITLAAVDGAYVDRYILTRTDTTGTVSVATNVISTSTNRVEVILNNLMGSNSLVSVFVAQMTTNGIPYLWLIQHGLGTSNEVETAYSDSDPYNNLEEYIADTDPTNSLSYFKPISINKGTVGLNVVIDPTSTARDYRTYWTTNLLNPNWQTNPAASGTGSNLVFSATGAWERAFFKGSVELKP